MFGAAGFIKSMGRIKERLKRTRYFTYLFISIWKILVFFCGMLIITALNGESVSGVFKIGSAFGKHQITVSEVSISSVKWRA